jgi:hypothetical protein
MRVNWLLTKQWPSSIWSTKQRPNKREPNVLMHPNNPDKLRAGCRSFIIT